ncbi:hypothetical protein FTUN_1449 [Frigoriglobus tundricola]|uniref:Uncharacterized protein n=1 Tax=Frigoriglobus tundricola TaxID=2774151 RepID=A0A6M5YK28_9BACT|nr:hypothetical protein FTUN_1449 [Frigoriglobus tundricola]
MLSQDPRRRLHYAWVAAGVTFLVLPGTSVRSEPTCNTTLLELFPTVRSWVEDQAKSMEFDMTICDPIATESCVAVNSATGSYEMPGNQGLDSRVLKPTRTPNRNSREQDSTRKIATTT